MFKSITFLKTFKNEIFLGLLLVFPILPIGLIGFIGILFSFLIIFYNRKEIISLKKRKRVFISIAFYLTLIVSLSYSNNYNNGLKEVLKTILLFVFPIAIILYAKIQTKHYQTLLMFYLIINILLCFYVFGLAIEILSFKKYTFLNNASLFKKIEVFLQTPYHIPFNWSSRDFKILLFFHKAYISMSLCLSALIALYFLLHKKNKKHLSLLLFLAYIFFGYFIIYMSSIPNIFALVLGTFLIIVYKLNRKTNFIILGLIFLISVFSFSSIKSFKNSIITRIKADFRIDLWDCAIDTVKDDLFLGIGFGDYDDGIINCYKSRDKNVYNKAVNSKMNSHNQYLSFIVSAGLVCLGLFAYLLIDNIINSLARKDILLLIFTLIIILNFCFENVLDRIYGIYFFSFFNSFFISRNLSIKY